MVNIPSADIALGREPQNVSMVRQARRRFRTQNITRALTTRKFLFLLVFSLIIAIFPWEELRGYEFGDREVYLQYYKYQKNILEYFSPDSAFDYYTHEVAWHSLIETAQNYNISAEQFYFFISVSLLLVFSVYLAKNSGLASLFVLINPLVIDLALSQLRMSLALSILGIALLWPRKIVVILVCAAATLVHSSSALFILIYISVLLLNKYSEKRRISASKSTIFILLLVVVFLFAMGPARYVILSALGDRRAEYTDMTASVTYVSYWAGLFCIFLKQYKNRGGDRAFSLPLFFTAFVALTPLFGVYTTRMLAAAFPILMASVFRLDGKLKYIALNTYIPYAILQWVLWFRVA